MLSEDTPIQINNDEVNNQLLVKGTPEELDFVEKIVEKLDLEKKQLMIEAYLINATDDFNNSLKTIYKPLMLVPLQMEKTEWPSLV